MKHKSAILLSFINIYPVKFISYSFERGHGNSSLGCQTRSCTCLILKYAISKSDESPRAFERVRRLSFVINVRLSRTKSRFAFVSSDNTGRVDNRANVSMTVAVVRELYDNLAPFSATSRN